MNIRETIQTPCPAWVEKLAALNPDDLSIEERDALDKHVESCPACAAARADYREMDRAILALPPVEPLAELPIALREVFGEQEAVREPAPSSTNLSRPLPLRPRVRARRWATLTSAIAAVLVVAALIGGFLFLFNAHNTLVGSAGSSRVIYVASEGKDGTVYAIRPGDGAVYWHYSIGQKLSGGLVASSDSVYASAGSHVYALNTNDGSLRWTSPDIRGGAYPPMLVNGNAIYLSSPDSLYALNTQDGHVLWSRKSPSCNGGCVAVFMTVTEGTAYVYMDGLYALRASDGQVIWHDPAYHFDSPSFAVSNGKVFVPDGRKGLVYELSASDGQLLHTFSFFLKGEPIELLATSGVIYIDNEGYNIYAIQASDGAVLWHKHSDTFILGLSAAGDGGLYFASTVESVSSIVSVQSSGSPVAVVTPVPSTGSPVVVATPVVTSAISTDVYAINSSDGSLRWHWQPTSDTGGSSNVLALDEKVYLTVGGSLYALSASDGRLLWVTLHVSGLTTPVTG